MVFGLWFEWVFGVDVLWILQDYPIFYMQLETTGLDNLGGPFSPIILSLGFSKSSPYTSQNTSFTLLDWIAALKLLMEKI